MSDLSPLAPGAAVLVAGARVTGRAIVGALASWDLRLLVCDDDPFAARALKDAQAISPADAIARAAEFDLVVTSPGFPPTAPVLAAAASAGVPIWGDVELAWRLDAAAKYGPPRRWLVVTGTNGKTTTTSMLYDMLIAGGRRAVLCGNIGEPVLDVLSRPADVLAVEVSSFQLFWAPSLRPEAGVVLNIAEDHLDWHGGFEAYAAAKAGALGGRVAVVGLDDPAAAALLPHAAAPVKVGFRLGEPAPGELGVRDGALVDRAFAEDLTLARVADITVAGPVGVLDALGEAVQHAGTDAQVKLIVLRGAGAVHAVVAVWVIEPRLATGSSPDTNWACSRICLRSKSSRHSIGLDIPMPRRSTATIGWPARTSTPDRDSHTGSCSVEGKSEPVVNTSGPASAGVLTERARITPMVTVPVAPAIGSRSAS